MMPLTNYTGSMGAGVSSLFAFALPREGVLKMNEVSPGVTEVENDEGINSSRSAERKGSPDSVPSQTAQPHPLRLFVANALELSTCIRGIGWKFGTGTGLYVAKDWRDLSNRSVFLRQTLRSIVIHFLIVDTSNSILARSGVRRPGGTVFGRGRNAIESSIISTFLTLLTGTFLIYGESCGVVLLWN